MLLAAGSVLALLAGVRPWLTGTVVLPAPLPPRDIVLKAVEVAPVTRAAGVLGLAAVLAVIAARGWLRVAVGGLVVLVGLFVVLAAGLVLLDPGGTAASADVYAEVSLAEGPLLALAAGLLLATAGLLVAVRGRSWSALGRRYDAPAAPPAAAGETDLWAALDRGEDPTGTQDPPGSGTGPRD